MNDVSGEDINELFSSEDPVFPEHLEFIQDADAYVFIIEPDTKEFIEDQYNYVQFLNVIHKVKGTKKISEPFAIVFTKDDLYNIGDPSVFADKNLRMFIGQLEQRAKNFRFFASRINVDEEHLPKSPLSCQGPEEVIKWLLDKM